MRSSDDTRVYKRMHRGAGRSASDRSIQQCRIVNARMCNFYPRLLYLLSQCTITYTGQPTPDDSHTRHHTRRVVRCKSNARDIFTTDSLHAPSNTLTPSVPLHRSLSPLALTQHTRKTQHTQVKKRWQRQTEPSCAHLRNSSHLRFIICISTSHTQTSSYHPLLLIQFNRWLCFTRRR